MSTEHKKETATNNATHSTKTPSLTEFDLAPYTGKAIQYICLDEQGLSKLSNQGFIHTTHSPIIKLEQTTPLPLYVRMFHHTKKIAATVHAIAATKDTLYLGIFVPPSTAPYGPLQKKKNMNTSEDNYTRAARWLQKTTYEPGHAARYRIEHILLTVYCLTPEQTSSLLSDWDSRFTPNTPYQSSTSANPIDQTSTQIPDHSSERSAQAPPSLPHTQRKQ